MRRPEDAAAIRAVIFLRPVVTVLFGDLDPIARFARRASLMECARIKRLGSVGKLRHGHRSRDGEGLLL